MYFFWARLASFDNVGLISVKVTQWSQWMDNYNLYRRHTVHITRPRGYKAWVHSQTQNKAQWLAVCGHVSASSQSLRFILSLSLYSSFITSRPVLVFSSSASLKAGDTTDDIIRLCDYGGEMIAVSFSIKNSKWVWSGNTTITNRRQPHGTARKSHSPITRHQEDKLSKATSSLFSIKMIAILKWI